MNEDGREGGEELAISRLHARTGCLSYICYLITAHTIAPVINIPVTYISLQHEAFPQIVCYLLQFTITFSIQ